MLGKREPQLTFMDTGWRERIPKRHFAWRLERFCQEANITEDLFADMFSRTGRPSISPVITLRAMLYQLEKGLSDRELEESSTFDDRVKLALGLSRDDAPLDAVTLCDHRRRFLTHDVGWRLLYITLQRAAEQGLLQDDDVHITDSFMVHGAGAAHDGLTLLRKAIRQVLRFARTADAYDGLAQVLCRDDHEQDEKPKINWGDPEARQQLLRTLVIDAKALVDAVAALPEPRKDIPAWRTLQDAAYLLGRIVDENFKEDDTGKIVVRHKAAKDRIVSVTDPEMRHGHKSQGNKVNGYKTNIITSGEQGNIITDVTVAPANVVDAELAREGVRRQQARQDNIHTLLGDTAFGGADFRMDMKGLGVEVVSKVHPGPSQHGRFRKTEFTLNLEEGWARCPQGHVTTKTIKATDEQRRPIIRFRFDPDVCANCPLRAQCTASPAGRTLTLHYHEELLQEKRKLQKTDAFWEQYRFRSHVERTIAHVTRHGGRYARYIGKMKTTFQLLMASVGHNIKQVTRTSAGGMPAEGSV